MMRHDITYSSYEVKEENEPFFALVDLSMRQFPKGTRSSTFLKFSLSTLSLPASSKIFLLHVVNRKFPIRYVSQWFLGGEWKTIVEPWRKTLFDIAEPFLSIRQQLTVGAG
jgi:hypothetical protein